MPSKEKSILLVEDHPDSAEMAQTLLRALGYRVSIATDGLEALEKAYQIRPDLILLDIVLPGMDGLEVARRLKADPHTSSVPILALTAKVLPGDQETCLENGCDSYLTKPFFPRQLKGEIEKLL